MIVWVLGVTVLTFVIATAYIAGKITERNRWFTNPKLTSLTLEHEGILVGAGFRCRHCHTVVETRYPICPSVTCATKPGSFERLFVMPTPRRSDTFA